ncbi:hypothetical protein [Spiroplasma clarkii]|uniref:Uncharacterized protein n=1 Tax=Spiroplasma clarkii TaxID=2139 RepID=A0A2K8KFN1_9MOLU|nr:hypothetical protein [Spiroplasma clarkii]ATX70495.1 hypothetical protein SCLAR_v1c01640 [Spiroplasma clarkii]
MKLQTNLTKTELERLKQNLTAKNYLSFTETEHDLTNFDLNQANEAVETNRLAAVAITQAAVQAIDAQRDEFGELAWNLTIERNKLLKELDQVSWSAMVQTKNNHIKALKKFVIEYNLNLEEIADESEQLQKLIYITVDGNNLFLNFSSDFAELEFNMQSLHPNKALSFVQHFYQTVTNN